MAETTFDVYHKWLGIPAKDQPVTHYRLLGIELFEADPAVIESAADRQMAHVRTFQVGQHGADSQKLLTEISAAKLALLNPEQRARYDAKLRAAMDAAQELEMLPPSSVVVPAPRPAPVSRSQPRPRRMSLPVLLAVNVVAGFAGLGLGYLVLRALWPDRDFFGTGDDAVVAVEPDKPVSKDPTRPLRPRPKRTVPSPPVTSGSGSDETPPDAKPSRPSPNSTIPAVPMPPAEPPFMGVPSDMATVAFEYEVFWSDLQPGEKFPNSREWSDVPAAFEGHRIAAGDGWKGQVRFRVTSDGMVLLAVMNHGSGGGGGEWEKEMVSPETLQGAGWLEVGRLASVYTPDPMPRKDEPWIVFQRRCKAGESFAVRTHKYMTPVLIEPGQP